MKNVTYINAGAGSGKTHTLIERLADLIEKDHIYPEQVILTTFTTKAATEFKEKAKGFLFKRGLYDQALRLDQALVGTVHSVANALVNKFWFKLGLPPAMRVMAEEDVELYISQSLSELPSREELHTLHEFARMFDIAYSHHSGKKGVYYDLWKEHLKQIIDYATNYEIDDFAQSREKSVEYIRQFVQEGLHINHSLPELQALLDEHQQTLDNQKESKANNERKTTLKELRYGVTHPTVGWYKKLSKLLTDAPTKKGPLASAMREELKGLWHSELVFTTQETYITLLFDLAARWQKRFADFKREKRVLDFNDMEKYLLKLTQIPSAREELALSFRYLFVDEFQDCSPIQVKIFDRLSDLMEHSYWVGDYKQSIYGFRGSDIALVKAVVDNVSQQEREHPESGCTTERLEYSWRSLPPIVDVCNAAFKRSFEGVLAEEDITLKKKRENQDPVQSLRYIRVDEEEDGLSALAEQIAWMVSHEKVNPSDIAVISRTNDPLGALADTLQDAPYCLPVNRSNLAITDSNAVVLVQALLQILISPGNNLAKATVAWLTEKDYTTEKLIDSKLAWDNNKENKRWEFLNDNPLVARLLARRNALRQQGPGAMVETLIVELGLYDVVKQWPDALWSASCLDVLINTARAYEARCMQMGIPATINGFNHYVALVSPASPGNAQGVQLLTYHACKGLQWKHVILLSLNYHPADPKWVLSNEIFHVQFVHEQTPTAESPYPNVYLRLLPFIYGKGLPEDIAKQIQQTEEYHLACRNLLEEAKRLLYVGMTRARDILTLAIEKPKRGVERLQWFKDIHIKPNAAEVDSEYADLLGVDIPFADFTASPEETETVEAYISADWEYEYKKLVCDADMETAYEVRDVAPSHIKETSPVIQHIVIGNRMAVHGSASLDYARVGNCIHQIYCSLDKQTDPVAFAQKVIEAYGYTQVLPHAQAIVQAWNKLTEKLTQLYGEAVEVYHERPFRMLDGEQMVSGSMDLVWKTPQGCVLVDFKSTPMAVETVLDPASEHFAGHYGGQVNCYTHALEEAEEVVLAKWIYYPVSGLMVELGTCYTPNNTYLMRWNPAISSFTLNHYREAVSKWPESFCMDWSIYEHEAAQERDYYYMLRTGDEQAGIVFRGFFTSDPYPGDDWAGRGKQRHYVDMMAFGASDPEGPAHIPLARLQEALPDIDWTRGHSGELLTEAQAAALEELWEENEEG